MQKEVITTDETDNKNNKKQRKDEKKRTDWKENRKRQIPEEAEEVGCLCGNLMRGILFNKCPSAPIIAFFHFTLLSSVSFYLVISFCAVLCCAVYSRIGRVWILEKPITSFGCLFSFFLFCVFYTSQESWTYSSSPFTLYLGKLFVHFGLIWSIWSIYLTIKKTSLSRVKSTYYKF